MRTPKPGRSKGQRAPRRFDRSNLPVPESRCENCRFWVAAPVEFDSRGNPLPDDGYRRCQMLAVLTERERAPGREKGHIIGIEEVHTLDDKALWMLLPTGPRFTCPRWMTNGQAAAVPAPETDEPAPLAQLSLFGESDAA